MHSDQWIKEVCEVDTISFGGESKGGAICIEAPQQTFGSDLNTWFTLAVEQYAVKVPVGIFVGQLNADRPLPFHIDDSNEIARQQSFDEDSRFEFFEQRHPQPTSFLLFQPGKV